MSVGVEDMSCDNRPSGGTRVLKEVSGVNWDQSISLSPFLVYTAYAVSGIRMNSRCMSKHTHESLRKTHHARFLRYLARAGDFAQVNNDPRTAFL